MDVDHSGATMDGGHWCIVATMMDGDQWCIVATVVHGGRCGAWWPLTCMVATDKYLLQDTLTSCMEGLIFNVALPLLVFKITFKI